MEKTGKIIAISSVAVAISVGLYLILKPKGAAAGGRPNSIFGGGGDVICNDGTRGNNTSTPCAGHGGVKKSGGLLGGLLNPKPKPKPKPAPKPQPTGGGTGGSGSIGGGSGSGSGGGSAYTSGNGYTAGGYTAGGYTSGGYTSGGYTSGGYTAGGYTSGGYTTASEYTGGGSYSGGSYI